MKKWFILFFSLYLCSTVLWIDSTVCAQEEKPKKAAIIIDDFGGDVKGVEAFLTSSLPITAAIMPFLPETQQQAKIAYEHGIEVIIHLPLEPKRGKKSWLGPNPITSDLPLEEVKQRVEKAIQDVPHAKGINNHMGSKIVENEKIMRAILEVIQAHNLYIIDSGTSEKSVIPTLAEEMGIPWAKRDIFIDDTYSSRQHVAKQMKKLAMSAEEKGSAIGIGHVGIKGNETVAGIMNMIPYFEERKIELVPVSHLMETEVEKKPDTFWQQ